MKQKNIFTKIKFKDDNFIAREGCRKEEIYERTHKITRNKGTTSKGR